MKAMILAAGLGTRMRPLTDTIPKPLLPVGNSTLIDCHLKNLAEAGIRDVVINISYLAETIQQHLGSGNNYGLNIIFSKEQTPLETAGGIQNALPLIGKENFLLINGDIWSDFPLKKLIEKSQNMADCLAHLILVNNPKHHPMGDFSINSQAKLIPKVSDSAFTFSGMSILSPVIFEEKLVSNRLAEVLLPLIEKQQVSAELYQGRWIDVGTPERLAELNSWLATNG